MQKFFVILLWVFWVCLPAGAQGVKIGFVSTERIFKESIPAVAAQKKIEKDFSEKEKQIQQMAERLVDLNKKYEQEQPVLAPSELVKRQKEIAEQEKEFQRKKREFDEDLLSRRQEEIALVLEKANRVIKQIAETEKFDLIVQDAVYYSPRIDLTDRILKILSLPSK
jgi:outer membrane protein